MLNIGLSKTVGKQNNYLKNQVAGSLANGDVHQKYLHEDLDKLSTGGSDIISVALTQKSKSFASMIKSKLKENHSR